MIARRGRDAAPVEGISVKFEVRDGGLHVLRVGDGRPRMAFFLPRSSGQKPGVRQVDLHASAGTSCFKLMKATPYGADGRQKVVLAVFPTAWEAGRAAIFTVGTALVLTIAFSVKMTDGPPVGTRTDTHLE